MKVEVKAELELQELPFPKLMRYKYKSELIVLFIDHSCGTVVYDGNNKRLGDYRHDWRIEVFTEFKGSITITQ